MSKIEFHVKERAVRQDGFSVKIGLPESTTARIGHNELLTIMNTLKRSHYGDIGVQTGFDYTLDFRFRGPDRFPYKLDMKLA